MSAERVPPQPVPLRLTGSEGEDAIAACLAGLVQALRMPASEAEAIRDELESHLRERVRDLEIAGMSEDAAVRCAAAELGDVSHLARRYREARAFPRRRLMMNLSMLAVAGAAVVVGVVTISQPVQTTRVSVFTPPPAAAPTPEARAALARTIDANFEDVLVGDVLGFVSASIGMPINVAWSSMPGKCVECTVSFVEKNADFDTILADIGEDLGSGGEWRIAYRLEGGAIRIATEEYFDRRELVLASYDLSAFSNDVPGNEVKDLVQTFVHPAGWEENGGSLGRISLAGTRMFVEAPKRYHVQIQWFIEELSKQPGAGHAAATAPAREVLDTKAGTASVR